MPDASLTLFADLGACHVQKSSVTICVLPAPSGWRVTLGRAVGHLQIEISIHALRTEGDVNLANVNLCHVISIHTLRVEGDPAAALGCLPTAHFYPRPPGGGRRPRTRAAVYKDLFLSTPSGWRATIENAGRTPTAKISIHALRVEGDAQLKSHKIVNDISIHAFRVEGDSLGTSASKLIVISIHALRVEGDPYRRFLFHNFCISIHALRVEGDVP